MITGEIQEYLTGRYLLVDPEQLTMPKENTDVLPGYWFPVDDQGRMAFHQPGSLIIDCFCSAQGNSDRRIVEMLSAKGYSPWHTEFVQLPVIYVPRCRVAGHR